jgi:hypothetical protein
MEIIDLFDYVFTYCIYLLSPDLGPSVIPGCMRQR